LDERKRVPILMHRLFDHAAAARDAPTGSIELRRCLACGFAWNARFRADDIIYDPTYDNCQTHSAVFRQHVRGCADTILASRPELKSLHIVEIGAGQGDFLKTLQAIGGDRIASLSGFDPAWRGADGAIDDKISMHRTLFTAETHARLPHPPDVIVSRHTIEHISRPIEFLGAMRSAVSNASGVEAYIETPDISWIVENQAIEDVFYEHCSIFDAESLARALAMTGFAVDNIETRFGGQYLWARARTADNVALPRRVTPVADRSMLSAQWLQDWQNRLKVLRDRGARIGVWGAGAKGIAFSQTIDPTAEMIAAIVDINPGKQNRYIGLTAHRVVAPSELPALKLTDAIVMNPVYISEIRANLDSAGLAVNVIPIHPVKP
jgi:2-polyprenyl-3-methyl-5-hydroxy-6-metoxy-1,4-benzoquinol methylase